MVRMLEFKILDMNRFLSAVNSCKGAVYLVDAEGAQENINQNPDTQNDLMRRHRENHSYLKIVVSIPEQQDYITLVNCFAGDCFQFFCGSFFMKMLTDF